MYESSKLNTNPSTEPPPPPPNEPIDEVEWEKLGGGGVREQVWIEAQCGSNWQLLYEFNPISIVNGLRPPNF